MPANTTITGLVLLAIVPLVVWDAVGTLRNGFDGAFWARPLEEKMDHIVDHRRMWERIGIVWIPINLLLAAGFTAFAFDLAGSGEVVWAALGVGLFVTGAAIFLPGAVLMVATVTAAAEARRDGETTPSWVHPAWRSTWWLERAFIISANVAYVAWGIGIVRTGFPATWVGWTAIVSGVAIAGWASLRDYFFQHMILVTPLALGVALIVA